MKPRYLTKSRFKLASECPTKLFYTGKRDEYADQSFDDPFLRALAKGGFQVGELAKRYFPGGVEIEDLDYEIALEKTNAVLASGDCTIYEAAIRFEDFFIRVDILRKTGNRIELFEVKAKSYEGSKGLGNFKTKNGEINSKWMSYLLDIAFQKFVTMKAFPDCEVHASLTLTDKDTVCDVDGLNQMFRVVRDESGRERTVVSEKLTDAYLETRIVTDVNVDELCSAIFNEYGGLGGFKDLVGQLAKSYKADKKIKAEPSAACRECQFRTTPEDSAKGLKSGFKECWSAAFGLSSEELESPTVFSLWDGRGLSELLPEGKYLLHQLEEHDVNPKDDGAPGMSRTERQLVQIESQRELVAKGIMPTAILHKEELKREMDSWRFPLHFIDFETTSVAIPFYAGQRPYDNIAFQFSHHQVDVDGKIEHKTQFLCSTPGEFPNFKFIRALKAALGENGTIFRYADHENTYLNHIYKQLMASSEPDREELCAFIKSISKSSSSSSEKWEGPRAMVDLRKMVLRYYYDHHTGGSNSIKYVLPAILNSSEYIQQKYSKPIYGSATGIKSLNFKDKVWVEFENGLVKSPYKLLPKIFDNLSDHQYQILADSNELDDGGAAMTAYARLQFEEMSDVEREKTDAALLKYCELDTLAMVMIYEAWREMLRT